MDQAEGDACRSKLVFFADFHDARSFWTNFSSIGEWEKAIASRSTILARLCDPEHLLKDLWSIHQYLLIIKGPRKG